MNAHHLNVITNAQAGGPTCNLHGDGPKHWKHYASMHDKASTCTNFLKSHSERFAFSALERYLIPASDLCAGRGLIYATILRDPIARIESAMRMHHIGAEVIERWATVQTPSRDDPIVKGSPTVDNFVVRTFAGKQVYFKVRLSD